MFAVQFRKIDGTLQLSSNAVIWQDNKASTVVSIPFHTVKTQLVNVSSVKVLLKITQWSQENQPETNYNFLFIGKDPMKDRERVKEVLSLEISKNRIANGGVTADVPGVSTITSQDIQIRQSLLTKDKELAKLHKELVMSGIIGEEEFWINRKHLLVTQAFNLSQKKGTSSASLADVKPSVSEGSDLKYTLTPEIIHSIFIQYPSVQKAYSENVPGKVPEKDFWTKFFASKYFTRTRLPGQTLEVDDLFKRYLIEDEDDAQPIPKRQKKNVDNVLLDLSTTLEDHFSDYGNMPDSTMKAGSIRTSLPLIRRFNRHSEVVLKSSNTSRSNAQSIESALDLEDLSNAVEADQNVIEIKDPHKYFESQSAGLNDFSTVNMSTDELLKAFSGLIKAWDHRLADVCRSPSTGTLIFYRLSMMKFVSIH
ncbi:hypothetical protein BC829DRAFT_394293 [Chytridium lagenaria]|nr:hypothetical protein BC829DRAFT_394293 [Chytridium lagenaria]